MFRNVDNDNVHVYLKVINYVIINTHKNGFIAWFGLARLRLYKCILINHRRAISQQKLVLHVLYIRYRYVRIQHGCSAIRVCALDPRKSVIMRLCPAATWRYYNVASMSMPARWVSARTYLRYICFFFCVIFCLQVRVPSDCRKCNLSHC